MKIGDTFIKPLHTTQYMKTTRKRIGAGWNGVSKETRKKQQIAFKEGRIVKCKNKIKYRVGNDYFTCNNIFSVQQYESCPACERRINGD